MPAGSLLQLPRRQGQGYLRTEMWATCWQYLLEGIRQVWRKHIARACSSLGHVTCVVFVSHQQTRLINAGSLEAFPRIVFTFSKNTVMHLGAKRLR